MDLPTVFSQNSVDRGPVGTPRILLAIRVADARSQAQRTGAQIRVPWRTGSRKIGALAAMRSEDWTERTREKGEHRKTAVLTSDFISAWARTMDPAAEAGILRSCIGILTAASFRPEVFTRERDNGLDADGNPVDPNYGDVRTPRRRRCAHPHGAIQGRIRLR